MAARSCLKGQSKNYSGGVVTISVEVLVYIVTSQRACIDREGGCSGWQTLRPLWSVSLISRVDSEGADLCPPAFGSR